MGGGSCLQGHFDIVRGVHRKGFPRVGSLTGWCWVVAPYLGWIKLLMEAVRTEVNALAWFLTQYPV